MQLPDWVTTVVPYVSTAITIAISITASAHAVLNKRDERAVIGWVGVIWLVPLFGTLLYVLLGVNRIRRRATALRAAAPRYRIPHAIEQVSTQLLTNTVGAYNEHLAELARLVERVTTRPLLPGNRIEPLVDGDQAFPAMLEAIRGAEHSISLATYIFDADPVGQRFVEALTEAHERGVEIRILIDDAGARYSRPPVDYRLRRRGIRVARFMPAWLPWRTPYFNLRNHRKILVVDGTVGFTGGMNIRAGHLLSEQPKRPVRDLHFRTEGPIARHLQEVFAEDWEFTTKEPLRGDRWFPSIEPRGTTLARSIADGPDEDIDQIRWTLAGALACARRRVRLVTPYFLPDAALVTSLNVAAMRGLEVDIVVPERCNIPPVQWAMHAQLRWLLERGCRVWLTPPPFDHTKLLVVDTGWVLLGSSNWDPRSLRLNFELNVESYDAELASELDDLVQQRMTKARRIEVEDLDGRPLPVRLRDGITRVLTPYL